jgi:hypothetical protein
MKGDVMVDISRDDFEQVRDDFNHEKFGLRSAKRVFSDGAQDREEFDVEVLLRSRFPFGVHDQIDDILLVWKNKGGIVRQREILRASAYSRITVLWLRRLGNRRVKIAYERHDVYSTLYEEFEIPSD